MRHRCGTSIARQTKVSSPSLPPPCGAVRVYRASGPAATRLQGQLRRAAVTSRQTHHERRSGSAPTTAKRKGETHTERPRQRRGKKTPRQGRRRRRAQNKRPRRSAGWGATKTKAQLRSKHRREKDARAHWRRTNHINTVSTTHPKRGQSKGACARRWSVGQQRAAIALDA